MPILIHAKNVTTVCNWIQLAFTLSDASILSHFNVLLFNYDTLLMYASLGCFTLFSLFADHRTNLNVATLEVVTVSG